MTTVSRRGNRDRWKRAIKVIASSNLAAITLCLLCLGATNSPPEFPGLMPATISNQPFPSNHVYATALPKTNRPIDLPALKYPLGANTNVWVLQSKCSERQGWVTITLPFYGTNGASVYVLSNQCVPEIQYRMRKL